MQKLDAKKLGLQHKSRYYCTLIGADYETIRFFNANDGYMYYSDMLLCRAGHVSDYESIEEF